MNYAKLLSDIISESGLSINEVAEKCAEYGEAITASYVSALKNNKKSPPSDKVSRALAKACGQSENLLVIQAYIENAPEEFDSIFDEMRNTIISVLKISTLPFAVKNKKAWKAKFQNLPLSVLIQEYSDIKKPKDTAKKPLDAVFNAADNELEIEKAELVIMPDDSMSPIIPQGSEISPEVFFNYKDYQNGDIICYKKANCDDVYVRQITFLNGEHTQMVASAYNQRFAPEIISVNDILILGKITQILVRLK